MAGSSTLARVGGPAVVVFALVPATVHARQLTLAVGLEQAVIGGVLPLGVSLAVAAYGIVLTRRDDDIGGVAAAGGVVVGTLLTAAVALWAVGGGVVTDANMARPAVVAAHVLTAGLAVGGALGALAERVRRTERVAERLFDGLSNPVARVVREESQRRVVNVIDGQATALADRLDRAAPELDAVARQTDGLLRLSERARQLESLVAGETAATETDLAALARERVGEFRDRDHSVTVETALPASPVTVRGNELLGAAVDELLDNVAHHAGPATTARVELTREGGMATLTVADDGPGLPETEAAVVDRTTESDLDHASGIGLWFVTWVLVELGGEVTVDGDDGTTVALHVPLATADGSTAETDDH